jgi:hypothetical protein
MCHSVQTHTCPLGIPGFTFVTMPEVTKGKGKGQGAIIHIIYYASFSTPSLSVHLAGGHLSAEVGEPSSNLILFSLNARNHYISN